MTIVCGMDVAILDLGSHTTKAGIPYNFPSDGEPSLVITCNTLSITAFSCHSTLRDCPMCNVHETLRARPDSLVRAGDAIQSYFDTRSV